MSLRPPHWSSFPWCCKRHSIKLFIWRMRRWNGKEKHWKLTWGIQKQLSLAMRKVTRNWCHRVFMMASPSLSWRRGGNWWVEEVLKVGTSWSPAGWGCWINSAWLSVMHGHKLGHWPMGHNWHVSLLIAWTFWRRMGGGWSIPLQGGKHGCFDCNWHAPSLIAWACQRWLEVGQSSPLQGHKCQNMGCNWHVLLLIAWTCQRRTGGGAIDPISQTQTWVLWPQSACPTTHCLSMLKMTGGWVIESITRAQTSMLGAQLTCLITGDLEVEMTKVEWPTSLSSIEVLHSSPPFHILVVSDYFELYPFKEMLLIF